MSIIKLTAEQLEQIQNDMNSQTEMLSDAEVNALAHKINAAIDLPFLNPEKEFIVFVKLIKWIDKQLYRLLPNEYYELVKDASDGISKEEAIKIEERLIPLINNVVNIPILTEAQEAKLIGLVINFIVSAMIKGFKLDSATP